MIDEADVQREFLHGPLTFRGAVVALQKLGYHPEEAEQVVSEWADDGEHMASDSTNRWGLLMTLEAQRLSMPVPGNLRG